MHCSNYGSVDENCSRPGEGADGVVREGDVPSAESTQGWWWSRLGQSCELVRESIVK